MDIPVSQQHYSTPHAQYSQMQASNNQSDHSNPSQNQDIYQPPPKQGISIRKIMAVVVVVVLLFGMLIVLSGVLSVHTKTERTYVLKVDSSDGQWVIAVSGGSENAKDVTLRAFDNRTGVTVYGSRMNALDLSVASFYDHNMNSKLDTGDGIILSGDSVIHAGMNIQLLKGDNVIGTIKGLPELLGGNVVTSLGLDAKKNRDGDWLMTVFEGSQPTANITIQVLNPHTLYPIAGYKFDILPAENWGAAGTEKGVYYDNNDDDRIDAGDSILLYTAGHHGGSDLTGDTVQFLKGASLVGSVGELPS